MTPAASPVPVLAVTGLRTEARIAAAAGVTTLSCGGDAARLALRLQASLDSGARAVISFGIAGGLAPDLTPGSIIVADAVSDGETLWPTHEAWRGRLRAVLPGSAGGTLLGSDRAIAVADRKAALHEAHRAVGVDMESHVAARLAAQHRVPFAALRIVADPAGRSLPRAALIGMKPDGTADVVAVLAALARRPRELPALIRTALEVRTALASLARCRRSLDPLFGLGDVSPTSSSRGYGRDLARPLAPELDSGSPLVEPATESA